MAGKKLNHVSQSPFHGFSFSCLVNQKRKSSCYIKKTKANQKAQARGIIHGEVVKNRFTLDAVSPSSDQEQERITEKAVLEKPVLKRTNKGYIEMQCPHCQTGFQINPKSINIPLPKKKKSKRVESDDDDPIVVKSCMRLHKHGHVCRPMY